MIIRKATREDVPVMHNLVVELAVYEKEPDAVRVSVEEMESEGFDSSLYSALVAEVNSKVVGFALYYPRYSTWNGRTMHLEDFYVQPEHRGKKIGQKLFEEFLRESKKWGAKQVKWEVLDWNEPALNFYKKYPSKIDGSWCLAKIDDFDFDKIEALP